MSEQECPECGKKFKNLGAHLYQAHSKIKVTEPDAYAGDDSGKEKPLKDLLSEIRRILRQYRNQMEITVMERNGRTEEVEIKARIQLI